MNFLLKNIKRRTYSERLLINAGFLVSVAILATMALYAIGLKLIE